MKTWSPSLFVAPLLLAAGVAFAARPHGAMPVRSSSPSQSAPAAATPANDTFATLDRNHDGVLSREELRGHPRAAHMAMVDENGDGVLSTAEFAEMESM